jgi:hypothetical protein
MDFEPYFSSATRDRSEDHLRDLRFRDYSEAISIGAILNSTTFFFWFIAQGNCRDLANADVLGFPVGVLDPSIQKRLASLYSDLMSDLRLKSQRRVYVYRTSGRVEYDEFYPKLSKPIIDEIDRVLADHYQFTPEELDFIVNFDVKYRMGRDGAIEAT